MSRWITGTADIDLLLASRELQQVTGGQANGAYLLDRAERTLATSRAVANDDPDSAYVLAYDAARYAGCDDDVTSWSTRQPQATTPA